VALSPSIPTSFVPKQPVSTDKRHFSSGGNNVLLIIATIILGITLAAAAAEFFYLQFLTKAEAAKAAQVINAQKSVSATAVSDFIQLRNRLTAAKGILGQHVALTQFFNLLETITAQNVHFDGVDIKVADDRSATITMTGQAKDFNSLAAQSKIFANQQYIKSAIFSGISVNKDNSVGFTLNASLDPAIVIETIPPSQQAVPVIGPVPPVIPVTIPTPVTSSTTATASTTTSP
jgi:hypothetical protein